ncbi:hypothetical protein Veis_1981 [Verminephrobacter eiseniae EF01-2]|uniref:Uncharacterized protein n=1 Tax=Verminephrobacter eiseniae (strain EF01-2) TaxID=391735 RepID=A1WJC6_VEREI|nr:hypothetical protein Veis_1981 [Verminephrobacter eiseniae EF01-2]
MTRHQGFEHPTRHEEGRGHAVFPEHVQQVTERAPGAAGAQREQPGIAPNRAVEHGRAGGAIDIERGRNARRSAVRPQALRHLLRRSLRQLLHHSLRHHRHGRARQSALSRISFDTV